MKAEFYKKQVARVITMAEAGVGDEADSNEVLNPKDYLDEVLLAKEKAMFKRLPIIVGHSSELRQPGDYIVREHDQRSWLLVRGKDGVARAFLNYCQHRGTKLLHDESGNCKHRLTCPYHAWTYNSGGELIGVPRSDLFPGLDKKTKGLRQGSLQEIYGFLWLTERADEAEPVDTFLHGLRDEFEHMGLDKYHLYFDKTRVLQANWKFPIFAFLESYHLAVLHKESIGDYFVENVAHSEQLGRHIRSFVPRQNVMELNAVDWSEANLAEYITPTNILFPNVCMISHPTSVSILSMFPGDKPGNSTWRHMLLVPEEPKTAADKAHYDKTINVLDGLTYEGEDYWVSEQIQNGINAGAIEEILLSKNEYMLKVFDSLVKANL